MEFKTFVIACIVGSLVTEATWALSSNNCLDPARISNCSPKCTDSSNCKGAQVCCTNICGTKSCAEINQYLSGGDKYKGSSSKGATGTYCGHTKCQSNEKCELDRQTKRQTCVRI